MHNKIKLFFSAFKLLFDFLKSLFSHPDVQVNGDGNNTTINTYNNIQIDNSKRFHNTITNNVSVNKYYPAYTPNISYPSSKDDDVLIYLAVLPLLILSNNLLLYPYFFIFKVVTIGLMLSVIVCNLHILLLSPNKLIDKVSLAVIAILSLYNIAIFLRFVPKQLTIIDLLYDIPYLVTLVHSVSLIAFSIVILINYTKDIIAISRMSSYILSTRKASIISLIFLLILNYLPMIMKFIIHLQDLLTLQVL